MAGPYSWPAGRYLRGAIKATSTCHAPRINQGLRSAHDPGLREGRTKRSRPTERCGRILNIRPRLVPFLALFRRRWWRAGTSAIQPFLTVAAASRQRKKSTRFSIRSTFRSAWPSRHRSPAGHEPRPSWRSAGQTRESGRTRKALYGPDDDPAPLVRNADLRPGKESQKVRLAPKSLTAEKRDCGREPTPASFRICEPS